VWDEVAPIAERAFAGQATFIEDLPLVVERSGRPEQAWFTFCYSPLRLADGKVGGFMDTVVETTAAVRARQDVAVLNEELAHRLKNTLSMVQAIAAQTLKSVESKDALGAFNARLAALGRAHEVLLGRAFAEASLRRAVDTALAPLDVLGRIAVTGPDFVVGARTTVSLSLILHELATNAVKYGALSVPGGRVSLSWTTDDGVFRMRWRESGGPEVHTPERDGFGARLIDAGLGVGGRVSRRYPPDGFEADLEAPLQTLAE
jgi:two-component sensor histidine kinase